jgi:hypothetical protein
MTCADGHGGHDWPEKPGEAEPAQLIPEWAMLWRGLALVGLAIAFVWAAATSLRASWLLTPVSLACAAGSVLAGWAALIHLTGGERFDDHPWV